MPDTELVARVVSPPDLSIKEISEWDRFVTQQSNLASPFYSHHYTRTVAEAGADVRICVIYQKDKIRAFLPYQFSNKFARFIRTAERVGGEMTDYFGLIADENFKITASQLMKLAKVNYLNFSHLDSSQLRYGVTGEKPRTGLRINLDATSDCPLEGVKSVTSKYLKDSKKRERKLVSEVGPIKFDFDVSKDRVILLDRLINQKRTQYKQTNVTDALADGWKRVLLHNLSEMEGDSCRGILSVLFAGEHWIASHFGLMGNGKLQLWFPVYNPDFSKYAPGRLLLHHMIQASSNGSFHCLDRGEGDTPRKREIENEEYALYRGTWKDESSTSKILYNFQRLAWKLGC